jgi:CRISPR/Cas system-associated exonuclease Cas4 (RecB family)
MSNDIEKLSASGIKKYRECEKAFWYKYVSDVEPPEEGEIEHFEVGNTVHDSIENLLNKDDITSLSQKEVLSELREEELSLEYNYQDSEKVQSCLELASKFISEYVENVFSVEKEMNMTVNGMKFKGYADLIADLDMDGDHLSDVVVDWKTGSVNDEWKERVQGGMYAKMVRRETGNWPDSIVFVYLNEDTLSKHHRIADGEVHWNDHKNTYWEEIEGDVSDITNSAFNDEWEAKPESANCYFCDYKYACSDYVGAEECSPENFQIGGII